MNKIQLLFFTFFVIGSVFSQGLINNGAQIVFVNNAQMTVANANGNYMSVNGGLIKNGTNGGTLSVQGNWVNNSANAGFANDGITIQLNGVSQNIDGTNPTTFFNLNLLGTGTKTLQTNATVGGISALTGVLSLGTRPLDLNSRTLTITNPAVTGITRTSGFIISETNMATNPSIVQWNTDANAGTYVFPFGTLINYIPVTVDKTSITAVEISASTRPTSVNNNLPWTTGVTNMASAELGIGDASEETTIDRWWEIQTDVPMGANLTLSYQGSENTTTVSPTGTFAMQRWNGFWEPQQGSGAGVTSGVGSVTATNVTTFSTFVLTTALTFAPLPITLTSFSGNCNNGIQLTWTTATESNVNHYEIYRSRNGQMWDKVTEVTAVGNSSTANSYQATDEQGVETMYYKLRSVDNDGKFEDFSAISIRCDIKGQTWNLYPTPATTQATIAIETDKAISGNITVLDMNGKVVLSQAVNLEVGVNHIVLDVQHFAKGMYLVKMDNETEYKTLKLMK